jgi:hypothetical protein
MGNIRSKFCADYQMNSSDIKFLLDGQRIHDDDTAYTLGLIDGDVIEVFTEMSGGGWPSKKNIYGDLGKIRDFLTMNLTTVWIRQVMKMTWTKK